jgi:threonine/homoserine/homoserine lactone efflux protein
VRTVIATAFATGFGLGFLVAAQIGPISLLCVRSVLRGRLRTGLGLSQGVAIVDSAYAALGVADVTQLLRLPQLRLALGLAGAAILLTIGARTQWSAFRIRSGLETAEETVSAARAVRTRSSPPGRPARASHRRRAVGPGRHGFRWSTGLARSPALLIARIGPVCVRAHSNS